MTGAWMVLLSLIAIWLPTGAASAAPSDLRILIDVSGSMRQNDPSNLRVPAMRLVNELLPAGMTTGVWTFAEGTEVLASPGPVDHAWRKGTRANLERIGSDGRLTDIERAIGEAMQGWAGPAAGDAPRHIMLLTDGFVDVAGGDGRDAASRQRILSVQLERLQALNVQVNALALSEHADLELLETLTRRTGGWLESVDDATGLQRAFLHMLERSTATTGLPLDGNRFNVDDRISELTLLAFRREAGPIQLRAPTGQVLSAVRHGAGVEWRQEPGYDLVTMTAPPAGEWVLEGPVDPDNRVALVTDLGIGSLSIPASLYAGEDLPVAVWLTDHAEPVSETDLLELVSAEVEITAPHDDRQAVLRQSLPLDTDLARFGADLGTAGLGPGVYRLRASIDGATFRRETQQRVRILPSPVTLTYELNAVDGAPEDEGDIAAQLQVQLDVDPDVIEPESVLGYVTLRGPNQGLELLEIGPLTSRSSRYEQDLVQPGRYQARARVAGRARATGTSLVLEPPGEEWLVGRGARAQPLPDAQAACRAQPFSWGRLALYLLAGNALLAMLLGLTWWRLGPRRVDATPC